MLTPIMSVSF